MILRTSKTTNKIKSPKTCLLSRLSLFLSIIPSFTSNLQIALGCVVFICRQMGLAHKSIDLCQYISGLCRSLKFTSPVKGYALVGHVIKHLSIGIHASCKNLCTMESQCVSINIGPPINGKVVFELSNSDDKSHSEDLKAKEGFTYRATQVRS